MDWHLQIARWLAESNRAVAFTGAGVSTESGIPDFRSPGGIWTKYRTIYFQEFLSSAEARLEYWQQKAEGQLDFSRAEPNAGHQTLARWEAAGRLQAVITQNIDGLHARAGSRRVLELHGTAREVSCLDCSARYDADEMVSRFQQTGAVPSCPSCGSDLMKHATVSSRLRSRRPRSRSPSTSCWSAASKRRPKPAASLALPTRSDRPAQRSTACWPPALPSPATTAESSFMASF
jgi:hypothetical protein